MRRRRQTASQEGRPRIHDLHAGQEPSRPFVVEDAVTPTDRAAIRQAMEEERTREDWLIFCDHAHNLLIMFPEMRDELNLDSAWPQVRGMLLAEISECLALRERAADQIPADLAQTLLLVVPVFPHALHDLPELEQLREQHLRAFDSKVAAGDWWKATLVARSILLFDPSRFDELPDRDRLYTETVAYRGAKYEDDHNYHTFLKVTKALAMMYPERTSLLRPPEGIWNEAIGELEHSRAGATAADWHDFGRLAATLTILSADEVRFTDDGWQLTRREQAVHPARLPDRPTS